MTRMISYHSSLTLRHLKDCPHLSVVSMHSSARLTGNFRQSEMRGIAMDDIYRALHQKISHKKSTHAIKKVN